MPEEAPVITATFPERDISKYEFAPYSSGPQDKRGAIPSNNSNPATIQLRFFNACPSYLISRKCSAALLGKRSALLCR